VKQQHSNSLLSYLFIIAVDSAVADP